MGLCNSVNFDEEFTSKEVPANAIVVPRMKKQPVIISKGIGKSSLFEKRKRSNWTYNSSEDCAHGSTLEDNSSQLEDSVTIFDKKFRTSKTRFDSSAESSETSGSRKHCKSFGKVVNDDSDENEGSTPEMKDCEAATLWKRHGAHKKRNLF